MIVLQQLKLPIEESHNTNDGYTKGGGEKHFVEHIFLLVYDLGLVQTINICGSVYKPLRGVKTGHQGAPVQIHSTAHVLSEKAP